MEDRVELLRTRAAALLREQVVTGILGFLPGTRGGVAQVGLVTRAEDAEGLVLDASCTQNIAKYLLKVVRAEGKVGVVARGCEARSIVVLLQERQFERARVYILGIGCEGVKKNGVLSASCVNCAYPNPVIYDELVGEAAVKESPAEIIAEDERFYALAPDERWRVLEEDVSRCIRCYACREVCPSCYCPVCFVDATMPQLVGRTHHLSDNMVFHIMRALHMAGRCVECGACERACPMGIDLMRFNRRVAKSVRERFGAIAGVAPEESPPLAVFDPADMQEFIR